jgi:hypothetical protein
LICAYEGLFPFAEDRDLLLQCCPHLDEAQLDFLEDGIQSACISHSSRKQHKKTGSAFSMAQPAVAAAAASAPVPMSSMPKGAAQGACAPTISGVELESLISSVHDLLPDLGEGFIEVGEHQAISLCNYTFLLVVFARDGLQC